MSRVLISVATYKRPHLLRDLLDSLADADLSPAVRLCVVDNDAEESARVVVESAPLRADYRVEPRPGIAAARNAGLHAIEDEDEFIVFVDDDERVEPNWLTKLLEAQRRYAADVVSGPVISVFPDRTPRWIVEGRFIQRPRFESGSPAHSPATNNTLLSLAYWRTIGGPTFDEEFSLTGGSDTAFFRNLRDLGARMVWTNDAVVYEDVPADRANFKWIWRRGVREGNVTGRLHLRRRGRLRLFLAGVMRICAGVTLQLGAFVVGRGPQSRLVAYITRGVGWVGASTNRLVVEYARPDGGSTSEPAERND